MNNRKEIFFALVLVFLMLFKVSAIHVYDHNEGEKASTECHLCDLALENQTAELDFTPEFTSDIYIAIDVESAINSCYATEYVESNVRLAFFSRPPPSLV